VRGSEPSGVDAVRAPEALPRALLDAAPIGIAVVTGADNHLEVMNPVYCRLVGAPKGGGAGRFLRDLLPESTALAAEESIAEVYRRRRALTVREIPLQTAEPPGISYWDVTYAPLPGEERPVEGVLMLAVPVTGQVQARQEADRRAAELQAVLGAISDGVAVFDAEGHLAYVNRALAQKGAAGSAARGTREILETLLQAQTFCAGTAGLGAGLRGAGARLLREDHGRRHDRHRHHRPEGGPGRA
jgi:PAS domain-containing protein